MSAVDGDDRSSYWDRRTHNKSAESFVAQKGPRHQREVDDLDYIVPRSGRYFEHDDRDVWTPGHGPPGERHVQRPRPAPRTRENPYKLVYGSAGAGAEAPAHEMHQVHHTTRPERRFREQGDRIRHDRGQWDRSFHGNANFGNEPPPRPSHHIDDNGLDRDRKHPAVADTGRYGERQSSRRGYLEDDADRDNSQANDWRHSNKDRFEGQGQHGRWNSHSGPPDRQGDWNADPGNSYGRDKPSRFTPGQRDMRQSRYEPYGRAPGGFGRGGRGRFAPADEGKWKHDKFEELQNPPEATTEAQNEDAGVLPDETEQEIQPSKDEAEDDCEF